MIPMESSGPGVNGRRLGNAMLFQLSSIIEQTADHVVITDRHGVIEYVNPSFEKLTGYTKEEVIGNTPRIVKSGHHDLKFYRKLWATILSGSIFRGVVINKKKSGELFYEGKTITPIRDGNGKITHFVSIGKDITEQKQAEEEKARLHRETERHLRHLTALHAVTAAASESLDLDNVLQEVIRKVAEIFQFHATRIYLFNAQEDEMHLRASHAIKPVSLPRIWSIQRGQGHAGRVAETGEPVIYEDIRNDPEYQKSSRSKATQRTGHSFFAVFPIKSKLRTVGTIVCVGRDPRHLTPDETQLITSMAGQIGIAVENAHLFTQLQDRTTQLESANKVKTEFLNVISHELRTPLNAIMGYTGLVQVGAFGEINPGQENALEQVATQSRELLRMINDILEVPKIEAAVEGVQTHEFPLEELIEEIRKAYDHPLEKELTLTWDYSPDVPLLRTDSWKLHHILCNLINNAVKFTDKGNITLSARYCAQTETIEFRVADEGIGISEEALPLIFEKFRQLDSSDTRFYGGVGLGLYIVKNFTELLGGTIDVESQPGLGSNFKVTIPRDYENNGVDE